MQKNLLKKLTYQATHRGMKELDVVLGGFICHSLTSLSVPEIKSFRKILEMEDRILFDLLFGEAEIVQNENYDFLVRLREYVRDRFDGKRLAIF